MGRGEVRVNFHMNDDGDDDDESATATDDYLLKCVRIVALATRTILHYSLIRRNSF